MSGESIPLPAGFYVTPWIGISHSFNAKDVTLQGHLHIECDDDFPSDSPWISLPMNRLSLSFTSTHGLFTHRMTGVFAGFGGVALYVLVIWGVFRWLRHRLFVRAQAVADTLAASGANIIAVRPSTSIATPAEVEFELDGKHARFHVRRYGRDWVLLSVLIDSPPQPGMWIRKKSISTHISSALGLTGEVKTNDPQFDAEALISTNASEDQVHRALSKDAVRQGVLDLFALDYNADFSPDGLRATHIELALGSFDPTRVPDVMRALEKMAPALQTFDVSTLRPVDRGTVSKPLFGAVMFTLVSLMAFGAMLASGRPLADDVNAIKAMSVGLIPTAIAAVLIRRLLRGRPFALVELIVTSILGMFGMCALTGGLLISLNMRLDSSAVVTQKTDVVSVPRKGDAVQVVPWDPTRTWQRVPVGYPLVRSLHAGDHLEVDLRNGAFGWPWFVEVRRVP
ncbi:MAG: hypothetical protein U0165_00265 [Polyangiaceae bacterium]